MFPESGTVSNVGPNCAGKNSNCLYDGEVIVNNLGIESIVTEAEPVEELEQDEDA